MSRWPRKLDRNISCTKTFVVNICTVKINEHILVGTMSTLKNWGWAPSASGFNTTQPLQKLFSWRMRPPRPAASHCRGLAAVVFPNSVLQETFGDLLNCINQPCGSSASRKSGWWLVVMRLHEDLIQDPVLCFGLHLKWTLSSLCCKYFAKNVL